MPSRRLSIKIKILYRLRSLRWKLLKRVNKEAYLEETVDDDDWEGYQDLLFLRTQKWTKRGKKVNVWPSDIPLPEGETSHWQTAYDGSDYLSWDAIRKLQKLVEDAEYERSRRRRESKEIWVKYLTMGAALLGALAGLGNLYLSFTHHK